MLLYSTRNPRTEMTLQCTQMLHCNRTEAMVTNVVATGANAEAMGEEVDTEIFQAGVSTFSLDLLLELNATAAVANIGLEMKEASPEKESKEGQPSRSMAIATHRDSVVIPKT